jgi:hypothetical protein
LYIPYLYGRQEEALALAELAPSLAASGHVVPLIEPAATTVQLHNKVSILREAGASAMIVANPTRGKLTTPTAQATALGHLAADLADAAHIRPVFRESDGQGLAELKAFLVTYPARQVAVVLTTQLIRPSDLAATLKGRDYLVLFDIGVSAMSYLPDIPAGRSIDIGHRFPGRNRNVDYANPNDEFFSNDLLTWKAAGRAGFSDFTVLPATYTTGGGSAVAIAVHLTYMTVDGLRVRHYVSDDSVRGDYPPKWRALLGDLTADTAADPNLFEATDGLGSFLAQARSTDYTSLGASKRQQIVHHVQTVDRRMAA